MIVDSHCHVGLTWYEPVESLLHHMERNGVGQAVLVQLLGQFDNGYIQESLKRYPGKFAGVMGVDIASHTAAKEVSKLASTGMTGIRLRPNSRSAGVDPLLIWRVARDLGLAVSCAGSASLFADPSFASLVAELPDLTIILEHLASTSRPDSEESETRARETALGLARFRNVHVKVAGLGELIPRASVLPAAGPPWVAALPAALEFALKAFGPARVMWGSDFPVVSSREGYSNALNWCREAINQISPDSAQQIFEDNARRMFRLKG